jgi:hypothetical protein
MVYQQLTTTGAKALAVATPPGKWLLQSAYHTAHEAVTAHDTNYATVAVKNGSTVVASAATTTTGTGDLSISEVSALALSGTAGDGLIFEGGEAFIFDVSKAASGVSISGCFSATLLKVA